MLLSMEFNFTYFPNALFAMLCFSLFIYRNADLLLTEVSSKRDSLLHRVTYSVVN
jgi:hypothetical protein